MEAKDLAALADQYFSMREARIAEQRKVDTLEEQEKKLKAELLTYMEQNAVTVIGGDICRITLKIKPVATAKDWGQVYEYIKENDAFDLLQKRLNGAACELRREEGIEVPGVAWFPTATLSVSKL